MKTKLRLLAVISMILSILLLVEVPIGAVAPILGSEDLNSELISSDIIETELTEKSSEIISEIEDERTENSKTFRLSDGTNMIAQYNIPIHYKNKKGDWVDYDNSLTATEKEVAVSNMQSSVFDEATADSVAVMNEVASEPNKRIEKKQMFKNNKSDTGIAFSRQTADENMVLVERNEHTVSWGYKDIQPRNARQKSNKKLRLGNDKFTVLDNLTSTVVYESAYDGVDIECITTPVGVKENIILNKRSATNKFVTTYDIGDLRAEKLNDREIALYNTDNKIEYYINALYMYDAKNETSVSIVLNILDNTDGTLVVELVADEQWLNDKERVYPVTIDPSFFYGQNGESWSTNTQSAYVDSGNKNTCYGPDGGGYVGTMRVGTLGNGYCRSLIKVNILPNLNKGDMIVGAYLNARLFGTIYQMDAYVGVYEALSEWSQSTVTWNTKPAIDSVLQDYVNVYEKSASDPWCKWDITKLVKQWYNGSDNYGVYLKMIKESDTPQNVSFYSSGFPSSEAPRPALEIVYRNNKGIEDYWSYTSLGVGSAGMIYVNDYSGALSANIPIVSTSDPIMPVSIDLTYNSQASNTKYTYSYPSQGRGWKMSIQQTLLPSSKFGLKDDDAQNFPYVYTDGDGTDHYFYKKTESNGDVTYCDEDGLNLKLTISGSGDSKQYTITTKDKNKLIFNNSGLLTKQKDSFGNTIQITYNGKFITSVKDKSGDEITFEYNSSYYITKLKYPGDKYITFNYTGNKVSKITYYDGTEVQMTYDESNGGVLTSVIDRDGYKLLLGYENASTKAVTSIEEFGVGGTSGQKITFDRTNYNETVIQTSGVNGVFDDEDNDDCITTCQFDNFGRTTATYVRLADGTDLGAESYSYTSGSPNAGGSNIQKLNRVSKHHSLGMNTVNYARNTSFETTASWAESSIFGGAEYTTAYDTTQKLYGQKSLKVYTTSYTDDGGARRYQDITSLTEGEKYTVSGYLKVTALSQLAESNSGAFVAATAYTSSGTTHYFSEYITEVTDDSINDGWRRVNVTFEVPTGTTKVRLTVGLRGAVGTAYFDGIQLEQGENVGSYNMVHNSSFESSSNYAPTSWDNYQNLTFASGKDAVTTAEAQRGSNSFRIIGEVDTKKSLYQEIPVSGTENDTYILSGWAKTTTAIPVDGDNRFRLSVHVVYNEKSDGENIVEVKDPPNFNTSITEWQYSSYAFTLSDGTSNERTPIAIRIFLTYTKQGNKAYFDNIQLIKEPSQSYTYDDDGNLVSVINNSAQNATMEYDSNNNLTRQVDAKGYDYEYTYNDTTGALETAKNNSGTTYTYAYESNGFCKESAAVSKAGNKIISKNSLASTSSAENYTITSEDSLSYKTESVYDAENGTLESYKDARGKITSYSYNSSNNALMSVTSGSTVQSQVQYSYTNTWKNLSFITTGTSEYGFAYDAFGNRTKTMVGSPTGTTDGKRTLATYTYGVNNGPLQSVKYGPEDGNGTTISYVYDNYGNVKEKLVDNQSVYEGYADKSGAITKSVDKSNNLQYNYVYDSTGRLISSTQTNTEDNSRVAMFEYGFDLNNNLTKHTILTPNGKNVTEYEYGADNLPSSATFSNGKRLTYKFDSVCLPTWEKIDTTNEIKTEYTYFRVEGSDFDKLTDVVRTEKSGAFNYRYKYNKNYNITEILETTTDANGTSTEAVIEKYTYDDLNQLSQAIDYKHNRKYVYTYDSAGNILSEVVTNNDTGAEISSKIFTYDTESGWGDLLVGYTEKTNNNDSTVNHEIKYTESETDVCIGNPINYRDGIEFSWSNGRQLDSYKKGDTTVEYTYDTDGMRLSKTVGDVEYTYLYEGGLLIQETRDDMIFDYSYDANGRIRMGAFRQNESATPGYFYYALNSRGDVVGLYNSSGEVIAKYTYDAWGNEISITDANGNSIAHRDILATRQPFRYRSYYYDTDSGFYYLQSRYYDPLIHRFINADNQLSTDDMTGMNLFAYCGNNPVNRIDPTGEAWWHWAIGAAVVAACAVATVVTCGGFAAAAGAVAAVGSGVAAATTASTIAAGAFIGSATVYGMAVVTAASTSSSVKEFNAQGNWGTVAATAGGAVFNGAAAYAATRTPTTTVYRSVSSAEAQDIKNTGQFNLASGGMESKQFGFNLSETRQFGNMMGQNTIVSAKVPNSMLNQLYTGGVDTSIFRAGTLTVYEDQLGAFNKAVSGTIKFMP